MIVPIYSRTQLFEYGFIYFTTELQVVHLENIADVVLHIETPFGWEIVMSMWLDIFLYHVLLNGFLISFSILVVFFFKITIDTW